MITLILFIGLTALGGVLYRLGGASHSDFPFLPKWAVKSYMRDIGIPIVSLLAMTLLGKWHWSLLICFPLMWGALSTYWKSLNKLFNKPTTDCFWFNWAAHGLIIGLSFIVYALYTGCVGTVVFRSLLMGILMTGWSEWNNDVDVEECGRGVITVGTLLVI